MSVRIQTPVGETPEENTGPIVMQGSVDDAIISSVSIGNDVCEAFADEADKFEVKYESVELSPLCFQDDILRMSDSFESAKYGNKLMENVIAKKGLEFNTEKSMYIVMGNKKARNKIKSEFDKSPITLCGDKMKEVKVLQYLGESLSINLEDSVHQTVVRRVAVARHAIFEIRTVIEDTRANSLGALNTAFHIWQAGILPMILFSSECWISISKKTLRLLDGLFHSFCQAIFRVKVGCPTPSFYIESASIKFAYLILERKLNFVHHLANLEEDSIAGRIYNEEIRSSSFGLHTEVKGHLEKIGANDLKNVSKWTYKNLVRKYIIHLNHSEILEDVKRYKKLCYSEISSQEFKRKSYFASMNLENGRMSFYRFSKIIPTIPANFSSMYRRKGLPLTCAFSGSEPPAPLTLNSGLGRNSRSDSAPSTPPAILSQTHLLTVCSAVRDIREQCNLDLEDDESVAVFFRKVVARNMDLEDIIDKND